MGKENFVELSKDELREITQRGERAKNELKRRKEEEREARLLAKEEHAKTNLLQTWGLRRTIPQRKIKERIRKLGTPKGNLLCDYIERLRKPSGKVSRCPDLGSLEGDTGCFGEHPADEV